MTAKTGNDKVNGDRGADDKQKTKPEGAGTKNVPEKMYGDHRSEPSREGPLSKSALPLGRGCYFCKFEEEKRATAFKEICEAGRAIAFEEIRAKGVCKKSFLRRSCGSKEPIGGWEVI